MVNFGMIGVIQSTLSKSLINYNISLLLLIWNRSFEEFWGVFRIFGEFGWVHSSVLVDKPGFRRVRLVFWIWTWFRPISGWTGSKFGVLGGVRMGSKLGFDGRTWVRVSSKFDLSSSKLFEVRYICVRSNTKYLRIKTLKMYDTNSFIKLISKWYFHLNINY